MADPIVQLPSPVISPGVSDIDRLATETEAARSEFYEQAGEFFSGKTPEPSSEASPPAPKPQQPPAPSLKTETKVPSAPAAPARPAPASVKPDDDDIPREYRPGSIRAEQWNKLHSTRDALRVERDALQKQLQETSERLKTTAPSEEISKQLQTLQAERDSYLQKLEAVAFERSPRFEAMFKPRVDAAVELAKKAVGPEQAPKIEQLLSMPDSEFRNIQINQLAENLAPLALGKLANAISEIDKVASERDSIAAKGAEIWKQWQSEEQSRHSQDKQAHAQQSKSVFDSEFDAWKDFDLFKQGQDPAHNQSVQSRIDTAKAIFSGGLDISDLARASIWAAVGPDLVGALQAEKQKVASLEADLAGFRKASPGVAPDGGEAEEPEISSNLGYGASIAALVQKEGLLR